MARNNGIGLNQHRRPVNSKIIIKLKVKVNTEKESMNNWYLFREAPVGS
jgi:hypothetical protein